MGRPKQVVAFDAHVHLNGPGELELLLNAAWNNFATAAAEGAYELHCGMLALVDPAGAPHFSWLREQAAAGAMFSAWALRELPGDAAALVAERLSDGKRIVLFSGAQIRTAEGLEVLAVATGREISDGEPAAKIIRNLGAEGVPTVLPWGVGKWTGRRRSKVRDLFEVLSDCGGFVGDNGGRPGFWKESAMFALARDRGLRFLSGTDPLPLPWETARVGSFGCFLQGAPDEAAPGQWLRSVLADTAQTPQPFGRRLPVDTFLKNQIALRWNRRRKRSSGWRPAECK